MCVHLYICMYGCVFQCLYACRGQRSMLHRSQPPCVLRQGLLLAWSEYARIDVQWAPGRCLSYPISVRIERTHHHARCSYMDSRDWAQVFMFAWRELYKVIHVHIINHQGPNETIVRIKEANTLILQEHLWRVHKR